MAFNPNAMTFAQGVQRLQQAARAAGIPQGKIVTSRDHEVTHAVKSLMVSNVPSGFTKWQLPVFQDGPTQFFFSYAAPGVDVPQHSHDEGDGVRVILHGSIHFGDKELVAGDWMFIPKGVPYAFKVGDRGAGIFYCYQCCCA
jgi:maltoporin